MIGGKDMGKQNNVTFKEIRDVYWKYYISLEEQFLKTRKYVEFDYVYNGNTYSIEYALMIAREVIN